jgi:hypothetical protein
MPPRSQLQSRLAALKRKVGAPRPAEPDPVLEERAALRRADVNVWCEDFSSQPQLAYHRQLQAEAEQHRFLIIEGPPEAGKSQQLTLRRTLWEIGRNPNIAIGLVSAKATQAESWVQAIARGIEKDVFRETFPGVTPAEPWSQARIQVRRSDPTLKDPTVQGIGTDGSFLSARLDLIILDDILTSATTATKEQREKLLTWIDSTECVGRLKAQGRLRFLGNTWTKDDAIHMLAKRLDGHERHVYRYRRDALPEEPAFEGATSFIPEIWPIERCVQRRAEIGGSQWSWQYGCRPRGEEDSRFKEEWFGESPKTWAPPRVGLEEIVARRRNLVRAASVGVDVRAELAAVDQELLERASYRTVAGEALVIGMDIGVGLQERHDQSAWVVYLRDPQNARHVLYVEKVRKTGPALIDRMEELEAAYPDIACWRVETVAAQKHLAQFASERLRAPVAHHSTTATGESITNKAWGMEQLAVRAEMGQLLFAKAREGLPAAAEALKQALVWYTPKEHTADEAMALLLAEMQVSSVPLEEGRRAGDPDPEEEDPGRLDGGELLRSWA